SLAHRSRSAPARRARIVLVCAEGHDNHTVARKLRVTPRTVGKWRNRLLQDRLEGLYDEPRPGAPRTITDEQVEQVVVRTLESTPRGVLSSVRTTTCSTCSSVIVRGAPGRGSSYKPSSRSCNKRLRHLPTVLGVTRSLRATVWLSCPSAQTNTMRARRAGAERDRDR